MTTQDRIQAIQDHGFTAPQARFLILVMRHSGLCIRRQYASYVGVPPGGAQCNGFFDKLVRRRYAVVVDCIHNRARLYHVHHKSLYHAIGIPDCRYRRAVPARQAAERLMRLDAALIEPDLDWFTTRTEKLALLVERQANRSADLATEKPAFPSPDLLPGTFPIGVDSTGRVLLLYVATVPWTDDFRVFLVGHMALLAATPRWTVRVVLPLSLQRAKADFDHALHEELENPLGLDVLSELRWYFFHRHRDDFATMGDTLRDRFMRDARMFAGPRFARLYRQWRADYNADLNQVPTSVAEAGTAGRAGLECLVLPFGYDSFSPLVSRRRSGRRQGEAADEAPDDGTAHP